MDGLSLDTADKPVTLGTCTRLPVWTMPQPRRSWNQAHNPSHPSQAYRFAQICTITCDLFGSLHNTTLRERKPQAPQKGLGPSSSKFLSSCHFLSSRQVSEQILAEGRGLTQSCRSGGRKRHCELGCLDPGPKMVRGLRFPFSDQSPTQLPIDLWDAGGITSRHLNL